MVEAMASLEYAWEVFGDPKLMDRVERLGFNALAAALTDDMWTHVYVQQANSVFAGRTKPPPPRRIQEGAGSEFSRLGAKEGCMRCREASVVQDGVHRGDTPEHPSIHKAQAPPIHNVDSLTDDPSGEDEGSNFYGVSHFPCCITNFPQGWPKLAAHSFGVLPGGRGIVVASFIPSTLTLREPINSSLGTAPVGSDGGDRVSARSITTVSVRGNYPFNDTIPIYVSSTSPFTLTLRIPSWISTAVVNGVQSKAGALHAVEGVGGADGVKKIIVELGLAVKIERGWGTTGVPTKIMTPRLRNESLVHLANRSLYNEDLRPTLLDNFGDPDARIQPEFIGGEAKPARRAHLPVENNQKGARAVELFSAPWSIPPTDGVAFTRGPLVFALRPTEEVRVTKRYSSPVDGQPNDLEIGTRDAWNYAIDLGEPPRFVRESSTGWDLSSPFSTKEYPFYLEVRARRFFAWGYWRGTNITDDLPPSPVDCSTEGACGPSVTLRLVPYGATNIRISVFPWFNSSSLVTR